MHTFIPTFYTNTTWFFICASDPQLIQVKFQIQIWVLAALASILHPNDENPHFHQFKHTEISFTSVVSSVGWVLWFCYKLQFWVFENFQIKWSLSSGVLYKSLSEWNNCQLPVFEILGRTSKGPLVKVGSFRLVLWFFKNSISQGSICMTLMHWFLLWKRENCIGLWVSAWFEALVGWAYSLYKVW